MYNYGIVLSHSAKGSEWKDHKYVRKVDGTYYYLDANGNETTTTHNINVTSGDKKDEKKTEEKKDDNSKDSTTSKTKSDLTNITAADLSEENVEKLAKEVIRGSFGNGQIRKDILGDNYAVIQKRVNELMKGYVAAKTEKTADASSTTTTKKKKSTKKTSKKSTSKKKSSKKSSKKTTTSDTVKHGDFYGELYLIHSGKGHDDNPPGRGSGRYAFGSGKRPHQHVSDTASRLFERNIKAGKDKPNTSLAEKAASDAGKAVEGGKNAVKTYDKVRHKKTREDAYKKAYEEASKMSDQEMRAIVNRKNLEKQYVDSLNINTLTKGEQTALDILDVAGDIIGAVGGAVMIAATVHQMRHK